MTSFKMVCMLVYCPVKVAQTQLVMLRETVRLSHHKTEY